jgi:cytoskeletal protein CcmA (bactofilin family)
MSFTVFGRGCEQDSSSPQLNGTSANHRVNGNGNGAHTNGHAAPSNGNGHAKINGNGHLHNGNGNSHANGNENHNGNGNSKLNGNGRRVPSLRTTLSSGVSIKGTVTFRSELEIDGEVEGTIQSFGRLTVGRNGHVRGDIQTRSVTVHGTVDGKLSAGEKCELRSGCTLRGDIETARLVMDENVNFIGSAAIATRDYLAELRPNGSK